MKKRYVFKFIQISVDRALNYWLLFQTCKITFSVDQLVKESVKMKKESKLD